MYFFRWSLHSEGGPLQEIVQKLVAEAEKSPRLMALVSLQLSKVLSANPAVLPNYSKEYLQMLLYGPPMNDNSFPGTALEASAEFSISLNRTYTDSLI